MHPTPRPGPRPAPTRTRTARVPRAPPPLAAAGPRLLPRFQCRELRLFLRIRFRRGFRPRFRPVLRQRVLHVRPAQAAQHRGLVHPQPPRDSASRTPCARHARARSHASSPVSGGRRPAGRTSAAVPSRSARWRSVAT